MINSNIAFITERKKIKPNQSPWQIISKLVQSVTLRTLASKYNGQKRRTPVSQAKLCWLQRQLYDSGRGRVTWLISQADFFSPPKRWRQYSRWRIPFHLNTKVLSSAGDCFFLGHRLEARCPSRKRVHLQAAGKGETCFEEVRGLTLPRCRCKTKTISPSSSCLKSEHGSTTTTQTVTAGESVGVPVFLHFHCQLSLFRWISEEESRSGKAQRKV